LIGFLLRSMRWFEKLLKSRLLYATKDAITEHEITISISAALDDRFGDRLAIETVPGVYKTVEEFNGACDEELRKLTGGLYNFIVLPLEDAVGFSNVLSRFIAELGREVPTSDPEVLVEEAVG